MILNYIWDHILDKIESEIYYIEFYRGIREHDYGLKLEFKL